MRLWVDVQLYRCRVCIATYLYRTDPGPRFEWDRRLAGFGRVATNTVMGIGINHDDGSRKYKVVFCIGSTLTLERWNNCHRKNKRWLRSQPPNTFACRDCVSRILGRSGGSVDGFLGQAGQKKYRQTEKSRTHAAILRILGRERGRSGLGDTFG